jgi:hypothetical protein
MEVENQQNSSNGETPNTLTEILNSISLEETSNTNAKNDDEQTEQTKQTKQTEQNEQNEQNEQTEQTEQNEQMVQMETNHNVEKQVQLLSNDIDRRIGNYLLNELQKKQSYIDELEEALKFQEKEIVELRQKLETLNELELLTKIKSNMDTKLSDIETKKVVQVSKKTNSNSQLKQNKLSTTISENSDQNQYPKHNPDLVFRSDPGTKVKSIPKEEEEPRYNGVIMLDKPKNEPEIKIQLDYETETGDNSSTMSDVVKQRRRARRL